MDWKEFLAKLKLIDIQNSLETEQAGVVNIKVENKTYNFNFPDTEAFVKLVETEITPDQEEAIKEDARKLLAPISDVLDALPDSTSQEVVTATTAASGASFIKKL